LTSLQAAFALSEGLGVTVKKLRAWAKDSPSQTQAIEIIHSVKAKYDVDQWLAAAKPLNDILRELQRDALVTYLLAHEKIVGAKVADVNRLFEYLLIDVGMDACMTTSRLKQAISSVQLFIHRVFLNLEQGLSPDLLDRRQWEWMQNYRVWEANRKVFLYPENWIEPELRDDKSPFFKDLENQLLQNEITDVNVEDALLSYLHKLDEVSQLEISGIYREQEGGVDLIHVFGRTTNTPSVHYYRRYDAKIGVWSPWEKVSLDIDSDLIVPVIWNRRLYIFWPTFTPKPDENQASHGPNPLAQGPAQDKWIEARAALDTAKGRQVGWQKAHDAFMVLVGQLAEIDVTVEGGYPIPAPSLPADPGPHPEASAEFDQWLLKKEAYDFSIGRREEWQKGHDLWESLRSALNDIDVTIYDFPVPTPAPRPKPRCSSRSRVGSCAAALATLRSNCPGANTDRSGGLPKRPQRATLRSRPYTENGKEKLPGSIDHRFQASVLDDGMLVVLCYSRRQSSPEPAYLDRAKLIGLFAMGACGDEAVAVGPWGPANSLSELLTPDRSRMAFMRFDEEWNGDSLTFYGPKPATKAFPVLTNSPTKYRLAHPPYSIEPKAGGFAEVIYPFGYQDAGRSYVGLPTLDKEPPSRGVATIPMPSPPDRVERCPAVEHLHRQGRSGTRPDRSRGERRQPR
jgi:hypothetical protein